MMRKDKQILFLCAETFPPIYAFLEYVFNKILPEQGYQVSWIMPSTDVTRVKTTYWGKRPVWLIPKVHPKGLGGLIKDYLTHMRYIQKGVNESLKEVGAIDMVQVRDDPIMAYVAWKLSRKRNLPFSYQISHLKEEENILYAKMRLYGSRIGNYLKGKVGLIVRNWLLRKADLVFPISNQMQETLASYGVSQKHMVTLPEGTDTSIEPNQFNRSARRVKRELNLESKKILIYIGTMNRFRQLDFLLRVLKQVKNSTPNAHLLMVGDGREPDDLPWLKRTTEELGIRNSVTFTGKVPRSEVPVYIRAADIGLSPFPPNSVLINNSPIKILEYLALEVPCVASDIPSQRRIIEQSGGGLCVSHDEQAFTDAVISLLRKPKEDRKKLGKSGRIYIQNNRDFEVLAQLIIQSYERILRRS